MCNLFISRGSFACEMHCSLVSTCTYLQDDCAREYFLVPYIVHGYYILYLSNSVHNVLMNATMFICNNTDFDQCEDFLKVLLDVAASTSTAVDCWVQDYKEVSLFS